MRKTSGNRRRSTFLSITAIVLILSSAAGAHAQDAGSNPNSATQLQPIVVIGGSGTSTMTSPEEYSGGQVARGGRIGLLGNKDLFDTPFSVTSYTAEKIQNDQATSVSEVLQDDPSILSGYPSGDAEDAISIRGFSLNGSDYSIDGLYGLVSRYGSQINGIERVEVFKGPNTLLNGVPLNGSIGGAINLVPKRATDDPVTSLTTSYTNPSHFGTSVDFGRRFGDEQQFGVRFNGTLEGGEMSYDNQDLKGKSASLALDYRTDVFRWTFDFVHDGADAEGPQLGAFAPSGFVPKAPDNSNNFYQPWEYEDNKNTLAMTRAEWDVSDDWTLYAAAGVKRFTIGSLGGFPSILNANGDTTEDISYSFLEEKTYTGEVGLRGEFETGPLTHQVALAASTAYNTRAFAGANAGTYLNNIYDPFYSNAPDSSLFDDLPMEKLKSRRNTGYAIADTVSALDDRVSFTFGARMQTIEVQDTYDESKASPAFGLVVKPIENLSLYVNYIEGLLQGGEAPIGTTNAGEVFAPSVTKSYEIGAKYDFGNYGMTAAYFNTAQPSGVTDPVTNVYGIVGEDTHQGVELTAFGEPVDGVRILGGVTFMESELSGTAGGAQDGKAATGVPKFQAVANVEYDVPAIDGLTVTGRVLHTGKQFIDADNTLSIPSWTRFDLGMRYRYERENAKPVILRAAIENVFNRDFWQSSSGGYLTQGQPLTVRLSTTFEF